MVCEGQKSNVIPDNYTRHTPPFPSDGGPVVVGVAWHVDHIHQVNVDDMTVMMTTRVNVQWQDSRLSYPGESSSESSNAKPPPLLLPLDLSFLPSLWEPDLFFLDTRDLERFSMMGKVAGLWIMANLTLLYSFMIKVTLDCHMDFSTYPFDNQRCGMVLTSYEYSKEELELVWAGEGVTMSSGAHHHLPGYNVRVLPDNITSHAPCPACALPTTSAASGVVLLSRRYAAHILTAYVPSGLFAALGWVSLFWPPDPVPGRTGLVVTSLLTVVSSYAASRHVSPKTDYIQAIDVWFFFCMCVNVIVLFQFAAILTLRRQQQNLKPGVAKIVWSPWKVGEPAVRKQQVNSERLLELQRREVLGELVCRVAIPVIFLVFNCVYWPYYLCLADSTWINAD